ncbi:motile sperm domain-containing protein 2-like [Dendronephthya gigantea]|uniref:motile sperm domain-containing protein 2-like n=1 Tax=Dendronephthya gigantea TaxID=151771 RepID=UPI00106A64CA|nr:motile sperm domain-containing protein 2-like [Dendronephthya gigantea]
MASESRAQPYMDKVPELRKKFLDKHYSSEKNYYDSRDISRVKSDDFFVVQFLNGKEGNIDKAFKIMVEAMKWRKSFGVNDLSEKDIPEEVMRAEVSYFYGRDKKGALLGHARLRNYNFKGNKALIEGYRKLTIFRLEKVQREHPGSRISFVSDLQDHSVSQVDMESNKFNTNVLTVYYPDILESSFILNYSKIFESLWKVTKALLGPISKKYIFTTVDELTQYIDKDQLPVEFGGPSYVYKYTPGEDKINANSNNPGETGSA